MLLSKTESKYIQAVYQIYEKEQSLVKTGAIAKTISCSQGSVTEMLVKLNNKGLVNYVKYKGASLTQLGSKLAIQIIRRHRLWEVFLVNRLKFNWEEITDITAELEKIDNVLLIDRLDNFLDKPKWNPFGEAIPNPEGKFSIRNQVPLNYLTLGQSGQLMAVWDTSKDFLSYLNAMSVSIGSKLRVVERLPFDDSIKVIIDEKMTAVLSGRVSSLLQIKRI